MEQEPSGGRAGIVDTADRTGTGTPSRAIRLLRMGWRCGPNWVRHHLLSHGARYDIRRHGPLYCGIYVTFRCNLTCPWCVNPPLPVNHTVTDYEADVESVARLLDHPFFRTVAHINLTGGEPLMNRDLEGIIRLLRRRGYWVGMVTNGTLLKDRIANLRESGIADIRVSMYANTVDRLASILPLARGKLSLATSYIVLRSELHEKPEAIENAVRVSSESGAVGIRLNFYLPAGGLGTEEIVYEDDPALADLRARLASRFPGYPIYWRPTVRREIHHGREKTCRQPWETFHVDARGNLGLCCRYCFPSSANGNLFEKANGDLFNTEYLQGLRAGLLAPNPGIPKPCENCLYLTGGKAARKVFASPLPTLLRKRLAIRSPPEQRSS